MSCANAPDGANARPPADPPAPLPTPLPLGAIVLLDPYAVLFQRPELQAVAMPVLIIRPNQSELPGEANATGLAASLVHPPAFLTVPGRHFVFVDICPAALQAASPDVCQDPPGVDRAAVHASVNAAIADFLDRHL